MSAFDARVGLRLATAREAVGLSQSALAVIMRGDGLKWSQATVWAVEAGDRPVRLSEAVRLAGALRCSLDHLTGDETAPSDAALGYRAALDEMAAWIARRR